MNKLLKYKFLPRQKTLTLSFLVIKLIEEFIPALHYKYVFQNFKQTTLYRAYNPAVVPPYLQSKPKSTILHCLHRKSKSLKYSDSDVKEVDMVRGIFEVKGKNTDHTIEFSVPSSTCKDWIAYHIPWKHFFAIFNVKESWNWDRLPQSYLESAYLKIDTDAIASHLNSTGTTPLDSEIPPQEPDESDLVGYTDGGADDSIPNTTTTEVFEALPSAKVLHMIGRKVLGFSQNV